MTDGDDDPGEATAGPGDATADAPTTVPTPDGEDTGTVGVDPEAVGEAIEHVTDDSSAADLAGDGDGARVFAVASGKGGVGKTTTVVNLAAAMAAADRDVVIVDFDLGMANVGDFLGFEEPPRTLHDVLAGEGGPGEAIVDAPGGFRVLPGGTTIEDFGKADPAKLRDVITTLREHFDVVILDSGAGLSHDTTVPLGLADEVLLVTTAQAASLANTQKTRTLADRLGGTVTGIVVTRVGGGATEDAAAIERQFDVPILGSIPEDRATAEAARAGQPLIEYAPDSPASIAYRELAYDLLGESLPLDFRDRAESDTDAEAADATGTGRLVEEAEEPNEPEERGLLSKLTGGLLGGTK